MNSQDKNSQQLNIKNNTMQYTRTEIENLINELENIVVKSNEVYQNGVLIATYKK